MNYVENIVKEHFHQLSKGQQKVAQYLIEQPQAFAMKSAAEIGKEIGVSETTVIRLCYSLKFSGFSEVQRITRESLLLPKSSLEEYHTTKLQLAEDPHFFAKVMEQDRMNIQETINSIDEIAFQQTVDQLYQAEKVYIFGMRSSFAPAQWFAFTLGLIRDQVSFFRPDTDDILNFANQLNERTAFVAISFHRYIKETVAMAELARRKHAFVCGITDSKLAPISAHVNTLLTISQPKPSTIDATPVLFSLLNALVAGVSIKDPDRVEKRKMQYEALNIDHLFMNDPS